MNKHQQCRAAIVAALPEFDRAPERLRIWIDKGRLVTRRTISLGYEWRYRINILAMEFGGDADTFMAPLLLWLRDAQPELFLNFATADDAIDFEADILDSGAADLLVRFDLVEAVTLTPRDNGGYDIVHLPEPNPDDVLIDGAGSTRLSEIWLAGDRLIPLPE